jgi:hypothetical protein
MRSKILLPLALSIALAGCASDYDRNTGIDCPTAIRIAEQHSAGAQYHDQTDYRNHLRRVERAEWDPYARYWLVDLAAADGYFEREYKINRNGVIIGYRIGNGGWTDGYGWGETGGGGEYADGYDGYGWHPGSTGVGLPPASGGALPEAVGSYDK